MDGAVGTDAHCAGLFVLSRRTVHDCDDLPEQHALLVEDVALEQTQRALSSNRCTRVRSSQLLVEDEDPVERATTTTALEATSTHGLYFLGVLGEEGAIAPPPPPIPPCGVWWSFVEGKT